MSLFPAYCSEPSTSDSPKSLQKSDSTWLINDSYKDESKKLDNINRSSPEVTKSPEVQNNLIIKKKKKKHKIHQTKSEEKKIVEITKIFTGKEQYEVDKTRMNYFLKLDRLPKSSKPRYEINLKCISNNSIYFNKSTKKLKSNRYYKFKESKIEQLSADENVEIKFILKIKEFNQNLNETPNNISKWLEFIDFQDKLNYQKLSKLQISEKKLEILERGLKFNVQNEVLLKKYIEILIETYPSDEIIEIITKLLQRYHTSVILWINLIDITQGSMTRCIVPDILKLYEKVMQIIYKSRNDEHMIGLFTKCALFLRQCGLYEQFFALIKLALSLNVSQIIFQNILPDENDQQILIDYEEVVLKSGLPMNEIWLRIEKLRQNFNFLPCPENFVCSDPKRIVFNEDICSHIFPLSKSESKFLLCIEILKLLKFPCFGRNFLNNPENISEFDDIEKLLGIILDYNLLPENTNDFNTIFFDLVKELTIGPSFLNTQIGWKIYAKIIKDILSLMSQCFPEEHDKSKIFVIFLLRFERLLCMIDKLTGTTDRKTQKETKTYIKTIFKNLEFRNEISLYVEYARFEYEITDINKSEIIFITTVENFTGLTKENECDIFYCVISWIEILFLEKNYKKALRLLINLAFDIPYNNLDDLKIPDDVIKKGVEKLEEKLSEKITLEYENQNFDLEQQFLPDMLINLIKAKFYILILLNKSSIEIYSELENLLMMFNESNKRCRFIQENLYELYFKIFEFLKGTKLNTNLLKTALTEYPENLVILRFSSMINYQIWCDIKSTVTVSKTPFSIIFLIISLRLRYKRIETIAENEQSIKNRIVNLVKDATIKKSELSKNSLLWRIYLRSLFDMKEDLDKCKNVLFTSLDQCPWNKGLYLDGAIFVPHELSQIQDLMIEKQLRIYALPEELEILRDDTF